MELEEDVRTTRMVEELEELRQEVEDVHRDLLDRLAKLCYHGEVAEKCRECARPCKQGSSVTVQSCALYEPIRSGRSRTH